MSTRSTAAISTLRRTPRAAESIHAGILLGTQGRGLVRGAVLSRSTIGRQGLVADIIQGRGRRGGRESRGLVGIVAGAHGRGRGGAVFGVLILLGLARVPAARQLSLKMGSVGGRVRMIGGEALP